MMIRAGYFVLLVVALSCSDGLLAQENPMQFMTRASARVARAAAIKSQWDGPVQGPKLQRQKKKIIFIASEMSDPSIAGLLQGVREAITGTSWEVLPIDCRASCSPATPIVNQALDMKPDGIILAGVDAAGQAKGLVAANKAKVPVVGWHASVKTGAGDGLFTNISSNPKEVAQIAALFGMVEANSKAGIVVMTDTSSPYSVAKSNAIVEVIKQCESCRLLGVEDVSIAEAPVKMQQVIEGLAKRYGSKWNQLISVNDSYFDSMEKPAIASILSNNKVLGFAAGDGSNTAYKRIRNNNMQIGTTPEPLYLHGWQLVDELNRAFSGVAPSGYVTPVHLVTSQNIAFDGGSKNVFDPANDYRNQYLKFWAKQ